MAVLTTLAAKNSPVLFFSTKKLSASKQERGDSVLDFKLPTFVNLTECAAAEFLNHAIALVKYLLTFNKHLIINYFAF